MGMNLADMDIGRDLRTLASGRKLSKKTNAGGVGALILSRKTE